MSRRTGAVGGETPESQMPERSRGPGARRRVWAVLAAVLVAGFVVLVVSSTRRAAVPVGASGAMPGMAMSPAGGGPVRMTMHDVDGRPLRIPDGRPGVALFVEARDCSGCADAVRAVARAVRHSGQTASLTVISVDSATSRNDLAAFAQSAGRPAARYVVDDRNGSLASMFRPAGLGGPVVYDAAGRIVTRPAASADALARALRRAGT